MIRCDVRRRSAMSAGRLVLLMVGAGAQGFAASPGPQGVWPVNPIAAPRDQPYVGPIRLDVDASHLMHRTVHVRETIPVGGPDLVLLYPKWLPGTHAPEGEIDRLAGIKMSADGAPVTWTRDPVDVNAFRVHLGHHATSVTVEFDYLSPIGAQFGALEMSPDIALLEWNELVLYPAGYYTRQIPVDAALTLPADFRFGTALEAETTAGATTHFKRTMLETLVDSPVYSGRYAARIDLDPNGKAPVHLDLFADRPDELAASETQIGAYRSLVQQAYKLFGSHHYDHYDFLFSLSDQVQQQGLEHHQSSEDGSDPESFVKWDATAFDRDLLPHEFTHSWNGKFRRPADLWTPNYDVPMQDSLLWVYEGQTEYWGQVLAARSGLRTQQQALDQLALFVAYYGSLSGGGWRSVADTTNDEIINPRRPQSWADYQRFEDYYVVGSLIWLDADTLIRERSNGARSLDDFARRFFGINDGSFVTVTYTFDDVVKALNAVEPYDWAGFLRERLDAVGKPLPLDGLKRGGYRLVYSDVPNDLETASEQQRKRVDLRFSIGVEIDDKDNPGQLSQVMWGSAAYRAGLTAGGRILAVNGVAYSADQLKFAIRAAHDQGKPIEIIVQTGDRFSVARVDYTEGLRFPHLERVGAEKSTLDQILAPRS